MSDQFSQADEIKKLYGLMVDGVISKEEFEDARRRVLSGERPKQSSPIPRMVAQSPPGYDPARNQGGDSVNPSPFPSWLRAVLTVAVLLVVALVIDAVTSGDGDSGDDRNDIGLVPTTQVTTEATLDPTATAIPRTGIQTIRIVVTIEDEWNAYGQGCVGSNDLRWASADTVLVVSPENASGTFQGVALGPGKVTETQQCQWSFSLTSRASDSYRITVGEHNKVCHSNTMFPTDDGFFAAVMLDKDGVQCASVVDVEDAISTP